LESFEDDMEMIELLRLDAGSEDLIFVLLLLGI